MAEILPEFDIAEKSVEIYNDLAYSIVEYSPRILGAVLILTAGIFVAKVSSYLLIKLVTKLKHFYARNKPGTRATLPRALIEIISKGTFWIILLFFIAAAVNLLEWQFFTKWINMVISYLPNLLTGIIIIITGYWVSSLAKSAFINTATNMHIENVHVLGTIIYYTALFTTVVVGVEQIGINIQYISILTAIILASLLISFTFAFTLGSKSLVANLIGARYAKKTYKVGSRISINDVDGILSEITQTYLVIDTENDKVIVPAKFIQDNICVIHNV